MLADETLFSALVKATRRYGRNTPGQWEDHKPGSYSYGDVLKMTLALGRLACKVSEPGEHVGEERRVFGCHGHVVIPRVR